MVSILEYDKEWEEKKLRKAEYEAGKSDGIEIAEGTSEVQRMVISGALLK